MAVSAENANLVWQKVSLALQALAASGFSQDQFRALKAYLAQVGGNKDIQFIPFTEADCDAAGGTVLLTGAGTLYAVFVKKEDEGTDNIFLLYDDATNDTTDANARIAISLLLAKQEGAVCYPAGIPLATGIVVTQYTSASGLGKADGSNGGNGFVIVGA